MPFQYKTLTIAGSDCSGGAGIQADLKTFSALGCYGMTVITAITAQNTKGVQSVMPIPLQIIEQQIDSIFDDIEVDCVKCGMLFDSNIIKLIARKLQQYKVRNFVLDPVMISKNGTKLLLNDAIEALIENLIPLATIITPNTNEAEEISNIKINNYDDSISAGKKILNFGCQSVLMKGGHMEPQHNKIRDYFISKDNIKFFEHNKQNTKNTHGTGCTLSAAVCSFLAKRYNIEEAVQNAINYLQSALLGAKNHKLGYGYGPVDHFFNNIN